MSKKFTKTAQQAFVYAERVAKDLDHGYIGTEHLLEGLVEATAGAASVILGKHGVTEQRIIDLMEQLIAPIKPLDLKEAEDFTPRAKKVIENSSKEATRFNSEFIGTEHILIAILKESDCIAARLLSTLNVNIQKIYIDILLAIGEDINLYKDDFQNGKLSKNKSKKRAAILEQFSRDLTESALNKQLDPVIGRQDEIQRIIQILSRRTKNNPCLIGEPGVGKTAVVEGLAARIVQGNVPETIKDKRVIILDLSAMVAGSKYRGEFEERIKRIINEVKSDGNILLFIDEIHTIIGAGGAEGAIDASNILKPSLARGEIQVIGATTIEEYRKHFEKDAALERRFQPVVLEEPDEKQAIEILQGLRKIYEEHHKVKITEEALEAAVKMSVRYINDRYLPDKAIDLIDEAASKVRLGSYIMPKEMKKLTDEIDELSLQKEEAIINEEYERASELRTLQLKNEEKLNKVKIRWEKSKEKNPFVVDENEIADVVSKWTKIPVKKLEQGEAQRLKKLESILHERVIGQEEAVTAVAKAIRRGRVGLKDPKRPIGSFLFLGPTGVGKTELSKALAEAMFGTENAIIRVDMSEYMEKHSVSKLIGSPPGYVGYEEGGQLSEKVRRNPYSVLLFDEIEKSHPDVFNILLQVLDDGHITDSQGRRVDFKNTVLIMTSNLGAQKIIEPKRLGFGSVESEAQNHEFMKKGVMDEVKKLFKPEFLNRIDETIVFHSLNKENIKMIVSLMTNDLSKRAYNQMGISLNVTARAKSIIAEEGFDKKYGARPLRRAIQNKIEDRLAEEILEGKAKKGNKVTVSAAKKELVFSIDQS